MTVISHHVVRSWLRWHVLRQTSFPEGLGSTRLVPRPFVEGETWCWRRRSAERYAAAKGGATVPLTASEFSLAVAVATSKRGKNRG